MIIHNADNEDKEEEDGDYQHLQPNDYFLKKNQTSKLSEIKQEHYEIYSQLLDNLSIWNVNSPQQMFHDFTERQLVTVFNGINADIDSEPLQDDFKWKNHDGIRFKNQLILILRCLGVPTDDQ